MQARNQEKVSVIKELMLEVDKIQADQITQNPLIGMEGIVSLLFLKKIVAGLADNYVASFSQLTEFLTNRWQALSGSTLLDIYHYNSNINQACVLVSKKMQAFIISPEPIFQTYLAYEETRPSAMEKIKSGVRGVFIPQEDIPPASEEKIFKFICEYLVLMPVEKMLMTHIPKANWKYLIDNVSTEIKRRDAFIRFMANQVPKCDWSFLLDEMSRVYLYQHIFGYRIVEVCNQYQNKPEECQKALHSEVDSQLDNFPDLKDKFLEQDRYHSEDEIRALLFILLHIYEERREKQHSYKSMPTSITHLLPGIVRPYSRDQKLAACRIFKDFICNYGDLYGLNRFLAEKNSLSLQAPLLERGSTLANMQDLLTRLMEKLPQQIYNKPSI